MVKEIQLSFLSNINKLKKYPKVKIGTDCSGIEAPIVALNLLGIKYSHEFSCDNNKYAKETIMANYKPNIFYDNIFGRNHNKLPDIDLYCCGFPCQSFSTAGKREGFDNPNKEGIIFFECLKVIKAKEPKYFILENVKGLLRHDKGQTFKIILQLLNKLKKYNIYYKVLRTSAYNIPQRRDRIYLIGIKKSIQNKKFKFPDPVKPTIRLDDILESKVKSSKKLLSQKKKMIVKKKSNHLGIIHTKSWAINLNASYPYATTTKNMTPCLVTTCNMVYLTKYNRFLTPRECLRLQGFPDSFKPISSNNQVYKQAGNSMSTNILCFLLTEIFKCTKI